MSSKGFILAVDDASDSLIILTETLTAEGYDVRPADSGELALSAVAAAKPELIILDIRMNGMDGFEVCRRLKATPENRDIPLIFVSSLNDTSDRVEGLKLGAVDFVSKPFQKEELLARIQTHLELSRLRNELEQMVTERTASLHAANEQLLRELAERIRAEQALRESEERFRSMADNAPAVIWTSGPDTKINFVNSYGRTLTGRKLEELTGDRWKEVVHPEDLVFRYPEYTPLIAAGREYRVEYRLRRADGEYRWVLDTAKPRLLADGSFAGYIGIAMDITDMKHDQEQLMAAQKLESLGVLVSGIAHTFNNLMAAIVAEADLALSELPSDSAACGNAERISSIAMRVADFVSLLRAYAGSAPLGPVLPIDVSRLVRETLQLVKATASKNVVFSAMLAEKLPVIRADVSQMRQVVMNILTNACESLSGMQGSVHVSTSSVHVSADGAGGSPTSVPPGQYVQLCVTDNGCGIALQYQTQIFDPFYTTKFLGRGLGLAAVQGIVRNLGGGIRVQSTPGRGSTFEILLPCIAAVNSGISEQL